MDTPPHFPNDKFFRARRGLWSLKCIPEASKCPSVLLQAVIIPGDKAAEGQLVKAVTFPWFEIIRLINRSPEAIYEIDWRKWEEIIAGAYRQQGFDVVLTPRSHDRGRDVIATHRGLGSIRFFDQVKARPIDQGIWSQPRRSARWLACSRSSQTSRRVLSQRHLLLLQV